MNQPAESYSHDYQTRQKSSYERKTAFVKDRLRNILEIKRISNGDCILDLGCSAGAVAIEASRLGAFSVGLDFSIDALKIANKLFSGHGKGTPRFVGADAARACFKEGIFDKIICADFVEHIDKPATEKVLAECLRLLKSGGKLILYTPCATHWIERLKKHDFILKGDKTHVDVKSPQYLKKALQRAGFKINRLYYRPPHFPVLKQLEFFLMKIPWLGIFFRRRICILAQKP